MPNPTGRVDAAIAVYLRRQDAESAAVLAATGDAGARRPPRGGSRRWRL